MDEVYYGYRFLVLALIIGANAFFAGSEVALLSVRPSRLRELADEGSVGAQAALRVLANPERLLSVVQVGVTLASLGLGWAGEDTLFRFISGMFHPVLTPATEKILHALSFFPSLPGDDLLSCRGRRSRTQELAMRKPTSLPSSLLRRCWCSTESRSLSFT
jgi:hypothetical protein